MLLQFRYILCLNSGETMGKRIQYGAASLKEIVDKKALYVDKTHRIYELINSASA